jgi:hypothetical protein
VALAHVQARLGLIRRRGGRRRKVSVASFDAEALARDARPPARLPFRSSTR